jgi:hypothetical protein
LEVLLSLLYENHVVVFGFLGIKDNVIIENLIEDSDESFLDLFFLGLSGSFISRKKKCLGSDQNLVGGLFSKVEDFILETLLKIENILFGESDFVFDLSLDLGGGLESLRVSVGGEISGFLVVRKDLFEVLVELLNHVFVF